MMGATGVSERRTLEIEFQCLTLTQLVDDAIYFAFCCRGVAMFRSNFFCHAPQLAHVAERHLGPGAWGCKPSR
jgi:hypothetical protein